MPGSKLSDIDGIATAVRRRNRLRIPRASRRPGRRHSVGGCSFMLSRRHAAAAIEPGLQDVLITHAESGK